MEKKESKKSDNVRSTSNRNSSRRKQKDRPKATGAKTEPDVSSDSKKKNPAVTGKNKNKTNSVSGSKNNSPVKLGKMGANNGSPKSENSKTSRTNGNREIDDKKKKNQNYKKPITNDQKKTIQNKAKQTQKDFGKNVDQQLSAPNSKNKRSSSNRRRNRNRNKLTEVTCFRIVARLLPPNLQEDSFLDEIKSSLKDDNFVKTYQILDYYFVTGFYAIKAFNEPTYSRAYFTFKDMEQLKQFSLLLSKITFVDDRDSAMKPRIRITSYVKSLSDEMEKSAKKKKSLEGTLINDKIYNTFLKSLSIMQENKDSDYIFDGSISLLKPLNKELLKQKKVNEGIEKKREHALVELAGAIKKDKKADKVADSDNKKAKKKKRKRRKKKSQRDAEGKIEPKDKMKKDKVKTNNNIVILEAAGKKELQKRIKLQKQKELEKEAKKVEQKKTPFKFNMNSQPFVPVPSKKSEKDKTPPVAIMKRDDS
ncbi:nonsense-mediated mRNA decay protein 3 [Monosporozyma unispora]|nr:hypothetical protein C6P44_001448 [Kazachstania unispora]